MTDANLHPSRDFEPGDLHFPMDVQMPSDVRFIERLVGIVARRCAEESLPPHMCSLNVPVALTEALSNAILYGNNRDQTKAVRFRATLEERWVIFEVVDEGAGFDLDACTSDPTSEENLAREDGRGLFLMRSLMDRVDRYSDGGNVVRLAIQRA